MISIKQHLDNLSSGSPLRNAYLQLIDSLANAIYERLPAVDSSLKAEFLEEATRCASDLREASSAASVEGVSRRMTVLLQKQWNGITHYFLECEREMAGIISLLADTAARLDSGNTVFYETLRQTAQRLDSTSRIADVAQLRIKLREQARILAAGVGFQEARSRSAVAEIQRGIESAQHQSRSIGRFVNTDTLTALPTKLHGEQMLADLLRRKTTIAVAAINLVGLQAIAERFDERAVHAVVREFATRLERQLPPVVHLYRWGPATFAVFADRSTSEELSEMLSSFALALASEPISIKETENLPAKVKPVFMVRQELPGADPRTVQATIEASKDSATALRIPHRSTRLKSTPAGTRACSCQFAPQSPIKASNCARAR